MEGRSPQRKLAISACSSKGNGPGYKVEAAVCARAQPQSGPLRGAQLPQCYTAAIVPTTATRNGVSRFRALTSRGLPSQVSLLSLRLSHRGELGKWPSRLHGKSSIRAGQHPEMGGHSPPWYQTFEAQRANHVAYTSNKLDGIQPREQGTTQVRSMRARASRRRTSKEGRVARVEPRLEPAKTGNPVVSVSRATTPTDDRAGWHLAAAVETIPTRR